MIPEGWREQPLEQIAEKKIVYGIVQAGEEVDDGVPYIRSTDVGNGIRPANLPRTHPDIHRRYRRSAVHPGDLVVSLRGNTGAVSVVPDSLPEANLTQGTARVTVSAHNDARFVRHQLLGGQAAKSIHRVAKGSTFTEVSLEELRKVVLVLPPLPEQKKIADILSTWDAAIETTDRLLANAERQKRALMQQLLTGKRRLKGFEGRDWKRERLGSLLSEVRRAVAWSDDDTYRLVSLRRRSGGLFLRDERGGDRILTKAMKVTRAGDFVISKMQVVHGAMGVTPRAFDGFHISNSYISLIPKKEGAFSMRFLDWLSRTREFYRLAYLSSYGVHIEKMTFNLDWFLDETIRLPSALSEQVAIADVLDTAECEVKLRETTIRRLADEKRALMQQLLTGKRRVAV